MEWINQWSSQWVFFYRTSQWMLEHGNASRFMKKIIIKHVSAMPVLILEIGPPWMLGQVL
jgi:hypothetical protein